jgi:hypothetical protein
MVMSTGKKHFFPQLESLTGLAEVRALARTQPERAFALALSIPDGNYRSKAMAAIAREAPDPLADTAFREARTAAGQGEDAYRHAEGLATALFAAIHRGRLTLAGALFQDILNLIPTIEPMGSRAYALNPLWGMAKSPGRSAMQRVVLHTVLTHCHPDRSWRAARLYRQIVANLAWDRPDHANKLIRSMPEGKARSFIERRRAEGERCRPY